ncbi:hypothetical protein OF83DRAFT_246008, partial [Amylostereum chailletii]
MSNPNSDADALKAIGSDAPTLLAAYKNAECISTTRSRFETDLTNALSDAYSHRESENHLYPVYSLINSQSCATLTHPRYPDASIAYSSQPLFGNRKRPEDDTIPPEADDILDSQIPDYARILVFRTENMKDADVRDLIDEWEIKAHNVPLLWDDPKTREDAITKMRLHLDQVYDQAMAAFNHNPEWERVYTLLI